MNLALQAVPVDRFLELPRLYNTIPQPKPWIQLLFHTNGVGAPWWCPLWYLFSSCILYNSFLKFLGFLNPSFKKGLSRRRHALFSLFLSRIRIIWQPPGVAFTIIHIFSHLSMHSPLRLGNNLHNSKNEGRLRQRNTNPWQKHWIEERASGGLNPSLKQGLRIPRTSKKNYRGYKRKTGTIEGITRGPLPHWYWRAICVQGFGWGIV